MSDRPSKQNKVENRTIKTKRKRENKKPNFRNKDSLKKPRKVRGRIIDYKLNKGWGKIMILEGSEKFVHFQFWKKNIDLSIEHHIYKNQEVFVQLDKRDGQPFVSKIDYILKERDLGLRQDRERENSGNRRNTHNESYSDRKPRFQKRRINQKPKNDKSFKNR